MTRTYKAQKAALTRAVKTGNPAKIRAEVLRTVAEWNETGAHDGTPDPRYAGTWPDGWAAWRVALYDATREFLD